MKLTPLIFPALLLFASAGSPALPVVEQVSPSASDFDSLNDEFEAALGQWKIDLREATKETRNAIRKAKPGGIFWDRFVALSDKGDGQAKLWVISHIRASSIKSNKRLETLEPLYRLLATEHSDATWFGDVIAQLYKDNRTLKPDLTLELYAIVIAKSETAEHKAGAMFNSAALLERSDTEESKARAKVYLDTIAKDFEDTTWAAKVADARAAANTKVGKMAPDFKGKTIDDFEFNLSDYKGKVVLLDFYGFW
ncbi:MAG: hypothetical protein ACI9F9_001723 [Candidatus Paceibacteria bacterium]|jgi:hypothetical protein